MRAHALVHMPVEYTDLLDEEFDSFNVREPFNRKPVREPVVLLYDHKTWDDEFDDDDMLCELEE